MKRFGGSIVASALVPQKMNIERLLNEMVKVQLRKLDLHAEGGLDSVPPKYVTPAMRELDNQLENINQQLEALGWIKRPESVRTHAKNNAPTQQA
jgi:hypothetical protein